MTGTRQVWQIEQGAACGCRGTDELCPCQNVSPADRDAWEITIKVSPELFGRIQQAVRCYRKDVYRKTGKPHFDPVLGAGQLNARDQYDQLHALLNGIAKTRGLDQ